MGKDSDPTFQKIDGSCHCGNVRFTLHWPGDVTTIPVRACGCSFCQKHRGVWTSHPQAKLDVRINDSSGVENYRFGTETADFQICKTCGAVPVVTSTVDGTRYGVVNANCIDDRENIGFEETQTDFETETTDDRLGRRSRNWISEVKIDEPAT